MRRPWIPLTLAMGASTALACSSLLGIHEPEVDPTLFVDEAGSRADAFADGEASKLDGATGSDGGGIDAGLVCPANRANCNKNDSDGCEVDITTPQNCGGCGHVCPACENGQCVPQTVVTLFGLDYSGFLFTQGTFVWWASPLNKGLYVADKSGGTPVKKAGSDPFDVTSLYVGPRYAGTTVYSVAPGVAMVDLTNQQPVNGIQVDACGRAFGVVADETDALYYAHASAVPGACDMPVMSITKRAPDGAGGFTQPWTFQMGAYRAGESEWMAVDATSLYFVGYRDTVPGIYKISRGGGAAALVAGGNFNSAPLAMDATSIYTIANNDQAVGGAAEVVAFDKATGAKTVLASGEPSFAPNAAAGSARRASLVLDATHVYWTAADDTASPTVLGRIMRVAKAGGAKEVLADKQPQAYGVALDDAFVYWTTTAAIRRIPK